MPRSCSLQRSLPLLVATLVGTSRFLGHGAEYDAGLPGQDAFGGGDLPDGRAVIESKTVFTFPGPAETSGNAALTPQRVNKILANAEGENLRVTLRCADWGVAAFSTRRRVSEVGNDEADSSYLKDFGVAGFTLNAYANGGHPMALEACPNMTEAYRTKGYASGAEFSFANMNSTFATFVLSFWRVSGVAVLGTQEAAESALATAVEKCITEKKLPVDNVRPWPKCLGDQLLKSQNSVFTFLAVISDTLADTIGENLLVDGFLQKTLSVISGGLTKKLTVIAMRR